MTAPEIRARKIIAKLTLEKLLDQWELTSTTKDENIYKFADADGNIFLWKTQKYIDEDDKIARLVGTVKAHDEFRGVKQTHLTRCKIA